MVELFPEGFEEVEHGDGLELIAYTDPAGEERMFLTFGAALAGDIEEGWEQRWRSFHRPVRIGELWIGPPWETPEPGAVPVVIDPGRAFGTGAHATTRLALGLLLDEPRGSLLDVGCGSGVLAVAAAKVGFAPVVAVDVDPNAVTATRRNAASNGVAVETYVFDATADDLPYADVAVANVTADIVEAAAPHLTSPRFIASGYLASHAPELAGYRATARASEDGWAADAFARTGK